MIQQNISGLTSSSFASSSGAIISSSSSGRISIDRVSGSGGLSESRINGQSSSIRVNNDGASISADFTRDGVNDLVQANRSTGKAQLFVNQSTPTGAAIDLPALPPNWSFAGLSDRDGNGVPDIAWGNSSGGETTVWLGTGSTNPAFTVRTEAAGGTSGSPGGGFPGNSAFTGLSDRIKATTDRLLNRQISFSQYFSR
jgi:hypothetical protein